MSEPSHGSIEEQARSVLRQEWRTVSIEHYGPDGTEVVAMLLFGVCPICAATVATDTGEHDLVTEHADYHAQQARALDALHRTVGLLREDLG